jgi:glycosyltransferase involved in cell wall biosynthesis
VRLLHVTPFFAPAPAYGGIARASAGLARELARRGHAVTVVTSRLGEEPAEREEGGVRVLRLPVLGLSRRLPFARGLRRVLEQEWPRHDVLHLHGHRHGLALRVAALAPRLGAYVLQPHGTAPHHGQKRLWKALFDLAGGRGVIAGARALVAVSDAEARDLPRSAHVVGNGVSVPARALRPRREGPGRLLFVGNGSTQKRAERLGALMAALPGVHLTLVGPLDGVPAPLQDHVARLRLAGPLDDEDLWEAYQDADLLVQPAVGEAFGLAAFEAALLGTPAVVAGGHGAGEWYGAAGGCVVPADDVAALQQAVSERLRNASLAREEAASVAAWTRARLTWSAVAERLEPVYAAAALPAANVA